MEDHEYHQRQQRRRYAMIGAVVTAVIVVTGWIVTYDVPEGDTSEENSLLHRFQTSVDEAKETFDLDASTDDIEESVNDYIQQLEYEQKREQEKQEADPDLVELSEEVFPELE